MSTWENCGWAFERLLSVLYTSAATDTATVDSPDHESWCTDATMLPGDGPRGGIGFGYINFAGTKLFSKVVVQTHILPSMHV